MLFSVSVLFTNLEAQNISDFFNNKELKKVSIYKDDKLTSFQEYTYEDNILEVVDNVISSNRSYITTSIQYSEDIVIENHFYPDSFNYLKIEYFFDDSNMLTSKEFTNLEVGTVNKYNYEYNYFGKLERDVNKHRTKCYIYNENNELIKVQTKLSDGKILTEYITYSEATKTISPCYDYFIKVDKLVVEKTGDNQNYTIVKTYFIDEIVNEIQTFVFKDNRVVEMIINNKQTLEVDKYILEYKDKT